LRSGLYQTRRGMRDEVVLCFRGFRVSLIGYVDG